MCINDAADLRRAHPDDELPSKLELDDVVIDFERYLNTLHRIGDVNDVNVFPRFEMMRYWSEQNVFNFDGVAKDERASLAANVYECIAAKLADAIRIALR